MADRPFFVYDLLRDMPQASARKCNLIAKYFVSLSRVPVIVVKKTPTRV
jgi:hypothetical protein